MRAALRLLVGASLAGLVTVGFAVGSRAPCLFYPADRAVVRLAWSARPERIEHCRRLSDEKLAKVPAHMRQRVVCEGTSARYRLIVARDGVPLADEVVRGGGVRHDRPIYLLREFPLPPGSSRLEVRFTRIDQPSADSSGELNSRTPQDTLFPAGRERRETEERERNRGEAIPPSLVLDRRIELQPRQVLLVTYDEDRRELVPVSAPTSSPR